MATRLETFTPLQADYAKKLDQACKADNVVSQYKKSGVLEIVNSDEGTWIVADNQQLLRGVKKCIFSLREDLAQEGQVEVAEDIIGQNKI